MAIPLEYSALGMLVRAADGVPFWLVTLGLAGAAAAGFVHAFRWLQFARTIEDIPTSRIRSASQGYVEIEGHGEMLPGHPLTAPLTGLPCVWWSYEVASLGEKAYYRRWRSIEKAVSDGIFLLRDDTASCIVDPDGAEVIGAARDQWRGNARNPVPALARLSAHRDRTYRYTEHRLLPGTPLYALGEFDTRSHSDAADRDEDVRQVLAGWKRQGHAALNRFDANADGEIDVQEWDSVRGAASAEVERMYRQRAAEPGVHVLKRGSDGRPFLLSTLSQAELAARYRRRSLAGLAAFFAAGACAVVALGLRLTGAA